VAADGQTWLLAGKNFLLPVKPLSRIFRAKFRDALRETACFTDVPTAVWQQEWVVHCQPGGNGVSTLKYLAPYVFRVAISNKRILKLEDGKVTFRYRTSDTGKLRTCTLPVEEFIRRFLQHVLPKGFVKVRYYGFLSSGLQQRLATLHQQLGRPPADPPPVPEGTDVDAQTADHMADDSTPDHVVRYPSCGRVMRRRSIIRSTGRCPP
jgi:hypothetical protein